LVEWQFPQVFSTRLDLFWLLFLLVEKFQLFPQSSVGIIRFGRLSPLPTHGITPFEEYVRGSAVPMKAARKLLPFPLRCHDDALLRSANSVKSRAVPRWPM
jgi:hypothetical protein